MWFQRTIQLAKRRRGFHLITDDVVDQCPEIEAIQTGILHLFIQHTSASLTITENADPDVRADLESAFNRQVPENQPFVHTIEGPDDMPAHVKSCMLGNSFRFRSDPADCSLEPGKGSPWQNTETMRPLEASSARSGGKLQEPRGPLRPADRSAHRAHLWGDRQSILWKHPASFAIRRSCQPFPDQPKAIARPVRERLQR